MNDRDTFIVETYLGHLTDLQRTEKEFLQVAARYSTENGISREAWLQIGVSEHVVDAARIEHGIGADARIERLLRAVSS